MKHLIGLLIVACCCAACGTTKDREQKAAEARRILDQVTDSVNNRKFTVEFNHALPRKFAPRILTSSYSIRVSGDSLISYLPYFGQSYRADLYGRDRSPLDFIGIISNYETEKMKKDGMRIRLSTRREMEQLTYNIEVFSNGKTSLDIISTDRDPISFSGNFNLGEQP